MIKRISHIVFAALACLMITSCAKKETFNNTDEKVGISTVKFFPSVITNGEQLKIINVGEAYTDEGATAVLAGEEIEYTTEGTFDVNTPGVYEIYYSAATSEGYSAEDFRTVVVIGADVAANDFSGTYDRIAAPAPQTSTWTKIANGVYDVVNPGGAALTGVIGVNYSGNTVVIPLQFTSAGRFKSTEAEYDTATGQYVWAIINGGYGAAPRTFKKQ